MFFLHSRCYCQVCTWPKLGQEKLFSKTECQQTGVHLEKRKVPLRQPRNFALFIKPESDNVHKRTPLIPVKNQTNSPSTLRSSTFWFSAQKCISHLFHVSREPAHPLVSVHSNIIWVQTMTICPSNHEFLTHVLRTEIPYCRGKIL